MPVKITKTKGGYRVSTPNGVKAKSTTKAKAEAQERLLNAVEHGWKPTGSHSKRLHNKHKIGGKG
jgi:hypothetical protein